MKTDNLVLGILADVDAGKTTLSESILFNTGSIRKKGRVDHGDTFLDTDSMERERGITIFSKQALFSVTENNITRNFTLLDTPGHADFSAETERVLSVLDYALLLISAPDGIRSHVYTLWKLLKRYGIPTIIFINKTDIFHGSESALMEELNKKLSPGFIPYEELKGEETALLDDELTERYLENGVITDEDIRKLINERKLFPVFRGSALKEEGIQSLLKALPVLTLEKEYPEEFSGKVFKITREKNDRLSHIKITGGSLKAKDKIGEYKAEQIRLYNGDSVRPVQEVFPGMVAAVTGLPDTYAGMGLGASADAELPVLMPLFTVTVIPTFDVDNAVLYKTLKELEEEIPELSVDPYSGKGDVRIKLMGAVQTDVIQRIMLDRFKMDVSFGSSRIVYKETVCASSEGVGHFEPLRHYAEVHLLLEPGERGSGMTYETALSEDSLPGHFQRLILQQLEVHRHKGVLTGSELTDVKVTLVAGKHHVKHTVGGDFRQSAYRALRHGLMKNVSKLLEPYYDFEIRLPFPCAGRAMSDISNKLCGTFSGPETQGDDSVLTGRAPVSLIQNYQAELTAYTKGFGKMSLSFAGYYDCHNPEEVVSEYAYDPDADLREPTGSVFCEHGAGLYVNWQEVEEHMHLPLLSGKGGIEGNRQADLTFSVEPVPDSTSFSRSDAAEHKTAVSDTEKQKPVSGKSYMGAGYAMDKELEAIFAGSLARNRNEEKRRDENRQGLSVRGPEKPKPKTVPEHVDIPDRKKDFLLVDGYNIIHAWSELSELARDNLDSARTALLDILSDYQGFKGMTLIAVFDAYRVKGGKGSVSKYHNIYEVYTKEAETADSYIEKTVHEIGRKHNVTVATSDALEQVIVFGEGAVRMSARELYAEVKASKADISDICRRLSEKLENKISL